MIGADVCTCPASVIEACFKHPLTDIGLAQAEAIADLIDASTELAARSAVRSLAGEFSRRVHALHDGLVELRMLVEATLDFPEEEIDFLQRAEELGFDGVIVTDALDMAGASAVTGIPEAAVRALAAGCDAAMSGDLRAVTEAVLTRLARLAVEERFEDALAWRLSTERAEDSTGGSRERESRGQRAREDGSETG